MTEYQEITLPGLTDLHVHPRDFAQDEKETFETCSKAAIVGGITTIAAMPNYEPEMEVRPYDGPKTIDVADRATDQAYCDIGLWGASQPKYNNISQLWYVQHHTVGLKFYIEPTQGNEEQFSPREFEPAARKWHRIARPTQPIAAHAEDETIKETIAMIAGEIGHPLHIPHVNNRFVLDAIIKAKRNDLPVTAGVCPHHLFMTEDDVAQLGWYGRMKPPLTSQKNQDYLWANLDSIDVFETDHAPHTKAEKDEANLQNPEGKTGKTDVKFFGVPGLEAMLPLLLQAVRDGKLTPEQLIDKTSRRPRQILGLPIDRTTSIKVSMEQYEFSEADVRSRCGWSPYALLGKVVTGRVMQVKLHGRIVYRRSQGEDGFLLDRPIGRILI